MLEKNKKRAFTMIELLVVISIIGILSTVAIVSLNSGRAKARDAKRMNDIRAIATAIDIYVIDNDHAPYLGAQNCTAYSPGSDCVAVDNTSSWGLLQIDLADYFTVLPVDPCGADCPGAGATDDPWYSYVYLPPANIAAYCSIVACGLGDADLDMMYSVYAENMEKQSRGWGLFASF